MRRDFNLPARSRKVFLNAEKFSRASDAALRGKFNLTRVPAPNRLPAASPRERVVPNVFPKKMDAADKISGSFPGQISEWWNALGFAAQVFYAIGGIALIIVVVQALLTLLGGDVDADAGAAGDFPHGGDAGLISVRTTTAFFMGFGLCGGVLLEAGKPLWQALGGGFITGLIFLFVIFALMKMLFNLRSRGNIRLESAKNSTGTVYVGIPADGASGGQIEVMISGRLMTFPAITRCGKNLPAGTLVRIADVLPNNIFIVEAV